MRERGLKLKSKHLRPEHSESLPVRERGLKRIVVLVKFPSVIVAPRAGAWIETAPIHAPTGTKKSLPVRERGLKRKYSLALKLSPPVAPRAGAWIETIRGWPPESTFFVAPRAGAWIETSELFRYFFK